MRRGEKTSANIVTVLYSSRTLMFTTKRKIEIHGKFSINFSIKLSLICKLRLDIKIS